MDSNGKENFLFGTNMSLGDHLDELRARLILAMVGLFIGLVICLVFGKYIINFMTEPYFETMKALEMQETTKLIVLSPAEGFASYMKIAMMAGLMISSPWVFYQLWMFVGAGLYPHERKYVKLAVPFSVILFIAGALFFMLIIAPLGLAFLVKFNEKVLNASNMFTFTQYVSFVTTLMLVFGVAFQTPIAVVVLNKTGLISAQSMKNARKYVILAAVVIAAIATPGPDVVSQVALAVPLYLLFELGMVLSQFIGKKKPRQEKNS